jgi:hypothetical protein
MWLAGNKQEAKATTLTDEEMVRIAVMSQAS